MQIMLCHEIASKMLRGRSGEPLIQFISRISMVGMALAVAILILVLSVMNGFEKEFRERILALVPHVTFTLSEPLADWDDATTTFKNAEGVVLAHPFVGAQALALRGSRAEPIVLQGLDDETLGQRLGDYHVDAEQTAFKSLQPGEVLIGWRLADTLQLASGDVFRVIFIANTAGDTQPATGLAQSATTSAGFKIAGVLNTGTELDTVLTVARLQDVATAKYGQLLVDGFQFQVRDLFAARQAVYPAIDKLGLNGYLDDWRYQYGNLYTAIQLSRQLVVILLAAIIAIAAFNIFVSLGMSVRHRQNEIAILRGYGMPKRAIQMTFSLQGIYIFLPGFIFGAIAGVLLAYTVPNFVELFQTALGIEFLDPSVYPIDYLPSQVRWQDVLTIFWIALGISLLATFVPSWRASRLNPASVLS